jgi:uncharacterized membrane protein HdeD (DUF308 family)
MKKSLPIYLYGFILILAGIFILFSKQYSFEMIRTTISIGLIVGSFLAFITAFINQNKQVQFAYHQLHASAMLVYGAAVLLFCNTQDKLISYTSFLFFYYAFSEIIFCNWIFNLFPKKAIKIVIIRVLLGLIIGVGTITALYKTTFTVQIFGALFIIIGINVIFYKPVIKAKQLQNIPQ